MPAAVVGAAYLEGEPPREPAWGGASRFEVEGEPPGEPYRFGGVRFQSTARAEPRPPTISTARAQPRPPSISTARAQPRPPAKPRPPFGKQALEADNAAFTPGSRKESTQPISPPSGPMPPGTSSMLRPLPHTDSRTNALPFSITLDETASHSALALRPPIGRGNRKTPSTPMPTRR